MKYDMTHMRPTSFHRDSLNSVIAGVCSGIARHFGWNANLLRALTVLAVLVGFGTPILIYIVIALVAPKG